MQKLVNAKLFTLLVFIIFTILFFYPVFLQQKVPFPGDLLLAQYQPWRSSSYNNLPPGAVPNKAQYFDTLRQLYPWKTFALEAIKTNNLPLWNPHNFSGSPLFANFQSALLFPLNVFYFFLPQITAWTILILIQPFLALIFVYLLSRKYGLSKIASILAASSYAFCLYMTTFLEYNIMGHYMYLIPLALLSIEWILEKKSWAFLVLTGTIGITGVAGHPQLFAGGVFYILFYLLIRVLQEEKEWKKRLLEFLKISFFLLLGICLSAVQILPGLELIKESARSSHQPSYFYSNLLIRPDQLLLYFIPDIFGNPAVSNYIAPFSYPSKSLYVGLVAIYFAIFGLFVKVKNKYRNAIIILTLLISATVFLNPFSYIIYGLRLPLFSTSSPSNFIFLVSLGLCILGGFGFDFFTKDKSGKKYWILAAFWFVFVCTTVFVSVARIHIVKNNLIYSFGILSIMSCMIILGKFFKKNQKVFLIFLLILSCIDLFYFFHKFNPFVSSSYIYPQTPIVSWLKANTGIDRIWGYSYAAIEPNFATQIGLYSPEGYDPLYPKSYGQLIQMAKNGKIPENFNDQSRSDALIANGFGQADMTDNSFRLKLLSILGVTYILDKTENGSTTKTFPPEMFENVASINDFKVLKYKKAAPRFFLTDSYKTYISDKDFTTLLFSKDFDPMQAILLDKDPKISIGELHKKQASLILYKSDLVKIKTNSDGQALLYLSDVYYPGWEAKVDNVPVKIYKANYAFRAVVVPSGAHVIEFSYFPKSILYGLYISIMSIMITMIVWLIFFA